MNKNNQQLKLSQWEFPIVSGPHTIQELEKLNMPENDGRVPQVPFGFGNSNWEEFKSNFKDGDNILGYCSSKKDWNIGMGREGYILVRNEIIIAEKMTRMN